MKRTGWNRRHSNRSSGARTTSSRRVAEALAPSDVEQPERPKAPRSVTTLRWRLRWVPYESPSPRHACSPRGRGDVVPYRPTLKPRYES